MMDLVQYRLQRLDERNAGLPGQLDRMLESSPLVFCAIGLICGIIVQRYCVPGLATWLTITGIAVTAGLVVCFLFSPSRRPLLVALAAGVAFACLGGIRYLDSVEPGPEDIASVLSSDGSIADLRGRIVSDVHIEDRTGWQFGKFVQGDLSSGFDLELAQVRCKDGWRDVTGTLRVVVREPIHDLSAGQAVQIYAFIRPIGGATNPGGFDAREFYGRLGVAGAAFVDNRSAIEPWAARKSESMYASFQTWLRGMADKELKWGRWQQDESDGLLEAFLLGTRSDITPQTYEAFRRTGLLHYISLSGMNIAIVIGAVWQFGRFVGITRRKRAVLCIAGIILFMILVPMQSPILRAGIIGIAFCTAAIIRRQTNAINSLAFAAILILLVSPVELFSVGWQLSFGCVLGILLFVRRMEYGFYDRLSQLMRRNISPDDLRGGILRPLARASILVMATGLAAWLGGGGFMLYHFYNITPLAALWTAITSPLVSLITVLGYIKMLVAAVLPTAGAIMAPVMSFLSWVFIWAVTLMAKVRMSEIVIGHVPAWLIMVFYAAVIYVPLVYWPTRRLKRLASAAIILIFVAGLVGIKWQRAHPHSAEITLLSVGHGQAALARLPGGNYLFDCGSLTIDNCGKKTILPFMRWEGADRINGVFVSHSDIDHCNGLAEVLDACRAGNTFVPQPLWSELRGYGKDDAIRRTMGTTASPIAAGRTIECEGARITTLWPVADIDTARTSDNDKGLVSMVEFGGRRILIASDIQQFAQRELLALYPNLKADVVIAPHHGSTNSLYKDFYSRLEPNAIVFSCDQTQQLRAQKATSIPIGVSTYFTSRDGAITITIGGDSSMSIETFSGGH